MINDLHPGLQFHQYKLLEQIGTGGQGVVWSAEDAQRGEVVAIKFNEVPEDGQGRVDDLILEQELKKLVQLRHIHVLPVHDYGLTDQVRYLVSPYISGGSLYEAIAKTPMQFDTSVRYALEIAAALDFLHDNHIIHRDLKPANVLLDLKKHSYLADFGLARTVSNTTQAMHTGRGTPPYSPPEQHKQLAITARSDLFSFGVMLFEMFTGQLPWNGEKILGMQQLYSKIEIQDPVEVNPNLPPQLCGILRQLTSSDPKLRPASAGEAVSRIVDAFGMPGSMALEILNTGQDETHISQDAQTLLEQKLVDWTTKNKQTWLSPTRFAMVHLEQIRNPSKSMEGSLIQFLLYHAIVYGNHDEYWWSKADPRDQAAASIALFEKRNDVIASRVLSYVLPDPKILSLFRSKSAQLSTFFLELAAHAKSTAVSTQLLSLLHMIVPPGNEWNDATLQPAQGLALGRMALQENELGTQALTVIGHLRSRSAVEFITKNAKGEQLSNLLTAISRIAGSLPSVVNTGLRSQLFLDWINQQLTAQPARLVGAYGMAFLGSTFSISLYSYLAYRLPEYLDLERIASALYQGVIIGLVFGLGIFLARLIVERFEGISFPIRAGLAVTSGTLFTSAAVFLFHLLFVKTMPSGFLIPAGCFLIACSYSFGRLVRWPLVKMAISTLAVFAAIQGSSWIHNTFATFITDLTPLFQFDDQWSFVKVGLTALSMALSLGVLGNLFQLNIQEE